MHRKIAATLFNQTWDLIEKTRNSDENDLMISVSQASLFHWRFAGGGDLELSRGHWIISRVYSILSMPESAIYHGNKCLRICTLGYMHFPPYSKYFVLYSPELSGSQYFPFFRLFYAVISLYVLTVKQSVDGLPLSISTISIGLELISFQLISCICTREFERLESYVFQQCS